MAQVDRFLASTAPSAPAPSPSTAAAPDDDRMKNAVAFLQHPKVAAAPLQQKVSFLQSKGLTKDEICRAFRQIDPNSPDAIAIEKGTIESSTTPNTNVALASPTTPQTAAAVPMYATQQQPVPMMYYPYVPQLPHPALQTSSSRLPLYSALAAAVLAAGGGLAYLYRNMLAETFLPKQPKVDDSLKDILQKIKQSNQTVVASLQKQSEDFQALITQLTSKIELLSTNNSPAKTEPLSKPLVSDYSSRPGTLSPAVQALLETTPSTPATPASSTFDFAAAKTAFEQALSELENSPESHPAVSVLKIYIKNLVETGSESTRYHRISVASPTYEQKVAPYPSAIDLLKAVGFRKSDGFLVWQAPLGGPSSQDFIGRKEILSFALDRLTELLERLEPREDDAA